MQQNDSLVNNGEQRHPRPTVGRPEAGDPQPEPEPEAPDRSTVHYPVEPCEPPVTRLSVCCTPLYL